MENQKFHNASNVPGNNFELEVKKFKEEIERKDFQHEIEKLKLEKQVLKLENDVLKLQSDNQKLILENECLKKTTENPQETSMDIEKLVDEIEKLKSEMKVENEKLKSEIIDNAAQMNLEFKNKLLDLKNEKLNKKEITKEITKEKIEMLDKDLECSNSNEQPCKSIEKNTIIPSVSDSDRFIEGISKFIEGVDTETHEYVSYAQWYNAVFDRLENLSSQNNQFVTPKYLLMKRDVHNSRSSVSFDCRNGVWGSVAEFSILSMFTENTDAWSHENKKRIFILHPTDPMKSLNFIEISRQYYKGHCYKIEWESDTGNLREFGRRKGKNKKNFFITMILCAINYWYNNCWKQLTSNELLYFA